MIHNIKPSFPLIHIFARQTDVRMSHNNFHLDHIPERQVKPRSHGLTMVMDKGLSLREAENFIEGSGNFTDLVKIGFGTSMVTPRLEEKINLYRDAGMKVYFGGTLFEAFIARGAFDDYRRLLDRYKMQNVEVSDGSLMIHEEDKCRYISELAKSFEVLSEVGSKEEGILFSTNKWLSMMEAELQAGSWKVITESRESGNVGIYKPNGSAHSMLVKKILKNIDPKDILWEAPQKAQQVWFINLLGHDVNLGNISPNEVIALETTRLGLRGDTFFNYLPEELHNRIVQED